MYIAAVRLVMYAIVEWRRFFVKFQVRRICYII